MTLSKKTSNLQPLNELPFNRESIRRVSPSWIQDVQVFDVIESTNTYLKDTAPLSSTLVAAHHQSAGRGTHQRSFYCAPHEGLYVSFSVNEKIDFPISLVIGASILSALQDHGFSPKIKWVNDIMIKNKKVGGILCEKYTHGVIVGFGINVNVRSFPPELRELAGSLHEFTHDDVKHLELCASILNHFTINMKHPRRVQHIVNQYLVHHQQNVTIYHCMKKYTGTLLGINEAGHLLLNTKDGQVSFNTTVQSIELNHD
ncbi:MAG: biotin--[acetyl-CoA-carboxylase] ligase [Erysipelothrix sp.]|jgi:BirA family biotin operon repressor/biotin-[acetyl-CoA-carboxylase] ligase|nr:biotin--[acetyl-CoA-carboxylase] ligase [Erysipelothrix sp.]